MSVASASGTPAASQLRQLEQDRRRDVVGQVAGNAHRTSAPDRGQRARSADRSESRPSRKSPSSTVTFGGRVPRAERRQIAVDLARQRPTRARGSERPRQRPAAGTDLEERRRPACGSIASTTLRDPRGSRKCWPNRLRATADADRSFRALIAAPVLLLDRPRSPPRSGRSSGRSRGSASRAIAAISSSSSSSASRSCGPWKRMMRSGSALP